MNFSYQLRMSPTTTNVAGPDSYSYPPADCHYDSFLDVGSDQDEFGFHHPAFVSAYPVSDSTYSSQNHNNVAMCSTWSSLETERKSKHHAYTELGIQQSTSRVSRRLDRTEINKLSSESITPSGVGHVIPTRSKLVSSIDMVTREPVVPTKPTASLLKRKSKVQSKEPKPHSRASRSSPKRKKPSNSTKIIADSINAADNRRKTSLEKNRLAAAKCRVNRRERTEQMQNDSREKTAQNALLKEVIMRMREQILHMNGLLLVHSNRGDCSRPEEIHKHFWEISNDYFQIQVAGTVGCTYRILPEHA